LLKSDDVGTMLPVCDDAVKLGFFHIGRCLLAGPDDAVLILSASLSIVNLFFR